MKKLVLKLDLQDDKELQRRALKTVSTLPGIDEIAVDLKNKKLTVVGLVDPVTVVSKLRKKSWIVDILSCGPKEEPKKEEHQPPNKEKEKEGGGGEKKEEAPLPHDAKTVAAAAAAKKKIEPEMVLGTAFQYNTRLPPPYYYPPPPPTINRYYHSMEENPNACVIC